MKKILLILFTLLLSAGAAFAKDAKIEWEDTKLSDDTIKNIQQAQYQYKKCVAEELQKPVYQNRDTRNATDALVKQCESVLAKIRAVYIAEKVPEAVADRHLKQLRIHYTRQALQELMFMEAARKSNGQ